MPPDLSIPLSLRISFAAGVKQLANRIWDQFKHLKRREGSEVAQAQAESAQSPDFQAPPDPGDGAMKEESEDRWPHVLAQTMIALSRRDGGDLSARQMAVFLVCYLERQAQTVGVLADKLNV